MAAGAPAGARALRHAVGRLMPVVGQVAMSGGLREYEEAAKILDEARRRLYAVLAGDQVRGDHGSGGERCRAGGHGHLVTGSRAAGSLAADNCVTVPRRSSAPAVRAPLSPSAGPAPERP